MRKTIQHAAIAASAFALAACSTESEPPAEQTEPVNAEGISDLDGDPEMFDAEVGRPAFDEAMRIGCPDAAVGRAECTSTGSNEEFACEYQLIDGEDEILTTTIRRDGDDWSLVETPAHCEPA